MTTFHRVGSVSKLQRTLLPPMVDDIANVDPESIYGVWPVVPTSYEAGARFVTYAELANMVNGLAWWLLETLGRGQVNEALAYVGPNDVRLSALLLAAIKAGYVLFLVSPRNSSAAHRSLFDALECRILLTSNPTPPLALRILEIVPVRHFQIPSESALRHTSYPQFLYEKTLEEGYYDPLVIIQTSGSTGIPKPLVWTQGVGYTHQNASSRAAPEGIPSLEDLYLGKRVLVTLPQFHGAGLGQFLLYCIPFGNTYIAPASATIVNAQGLADALEHTQVDIALLVPSVVAELAKSPDLLRYCAKRLELIVYIGGDLPREIGDAVAAEIPLRCQWGASEIGMPQQLMPPELDPRVDWRYIRFHPCAGAIFDEVADGTYELVIQRRESLANTQPTFMIRGKEKLNEYRTGDLFVPHTTIPNTWSWTARADDIIVFLNGEKTNPISMEQYITARNPEISGAIVVGAQRFQAALLIEPVETAKTTAEQISLIERVWPSIKEANQVAPAHARVEKSLIMVTAPDRPLARTGKGTLQRRACLELYKMEIDTLYEQVETNQEGEDDAAIDPVGDRGLIVQRIRKIILDVTGWPYIEDSADIFERGVDSLQALQVMRALRRVLHMPHIGLSTIYHNSSVSELVDVVSAETDEKSDRDTMESLLATYCQLVRQIARPKIFLTSSEAPVNVMLTGSTGALGGMFLQALLNRPGVGHIYCMNRGNDGGRLAFESRSSAMNRAAANIEDRVTFIQADLARPKLGLDDTTYDILRHDVGLIIHNAWPVNFNLALSTFRPQLVGMVNLFSLAAAANHSMRVFFISSVGAVASLPASIGPAPETIIRSLDMSYASGYARSKLLSELLCDTARQHLDIPVSIARIGQVAGPVGSGMWNRTEWLPSLVISSVYLGCLPEDLGPRFSNIDWIPSDLLAEVVVDLASSPIPKPDVNNSPEVFNLRNPNTTTWAEVLPALKDAVHMRYEKELEVVPPSSWLQRLQNSGNGNTYDAAFMASNPAIKLLAFYRDSLWGAGSTAEPMSIEHAITRSPSLGNIAAIRRDWMRKWAEDWLA